MASVLLVTRKIDPGSYAPPQDWDGSSRSAIELDSVEFQVSAFTGTGPWIPQRSMDGVNWDNCQVRDQFNTFYASLTNAAHAGKCLSAKGRGYFRLYSATSGDTVTGQIRAS